MFDSWCVYLKCFTSHLLKTCNNLRVQCQRSSWNLTNLLVDFWVICHGAVLSIKTFSLIFSPFGYSSEPLFHLWVPIICSMLLVVFSRLFFIIVIHFQVSFWLFVIIFWFHWWLWSLLVCLWYWSLLLEWVSYPS